MSAVLQRRFVSRLRERMQSAGVSQSDLARRMAVTPSYVSQILSGHRRPGLDTLEAVATALECDPAELISSTEENCVKSA